MESDADPLRVLEEILQRNSDFADAVNLRNAEVHHYFYFDRITDPADLEAAWAVFPEHQEIRQRLARIERVATTGDKQMCSGLPGDERWRIRVPKEGNRCTDDDLKRIVGGIGSKTTISTQPSST